MNVKLQFQIQVSTTFLQKAMCCYFTELVCLLYVPFLIADSTFYIKLGPQTEGSSELSGGDFLCSPVSHTFCFLLFLDPFRILLFLDTFCFLLFLDTICFLLFLDTCLKGPAEEETQFQNTFQICLEKGETLFFLFLGPF